MRLRIDSFERPGLVVKRRWHGRFTITYGEILTAERIVTGRGLRLHTRTTDPVRVVCRGTERIEIENELRRRGVRIVDEYGAIIAPTLEDFEQELARRPRPMRQSSDNA